MVNESAKSEPSLDQTVATGLWQEAWKRLAKNRLALVGAVVILIMVLASLLGPLIIQALTGYTYDSIPRDSSLVKAMPPSIHHWMGTDNLGRDMLARVLYGGRISLMVSLVATLVSLVIGVSYGAIAGYFG